jgi:cell division protein FtsB
MRLKGRHWLLLWLGLFLAVAAVVIARQAASFRLARELGKLRTEHASLEARRAELERRIRGASSRQVLGSRAFRALGLHDPSDSEFMLFRVPKGTPGEPR